MKWLSQSFKKLESVGLLTSSVKVNTPRWRRRVVCVFKLLFQRTNPHFTVLEKLIFIKSTHLEHVVIFAFILIFLRLSIFHNYSFYSLFYIISKTRHIKFSDHQIFRF